MSMSDPIADMLTRIRNAQATEKVSVVDAGIQGEARDRARSSRTRATSRTSRSATVDGKPVLEIGLKYYAGKPVIEKIERVSRPGLRIYKGRDDIPRVMNGLGVAIVSTSRGVMTDRRARETGVGGEVLCIVV